jgi:hypothetical protein
MNDNREIFEVSGVYENPRRKTLTLALRVYVICLKYMKLVEFDTKGVNMIRVDFGPISETVYIDIILNKIIER